MATVDDRVARESGTGPEKKSLTEVRLDDELFAGSKGPKKLLASSLAPLLGAFPPHCLTLFQQYLSIHVHRTSVYARQSPSDLLWANRSLRSGMRGIMLIANSFSSERARN